MRIVSLCPSLTELVFDLGRGAELVGRTKFCIHPAGAVDQVEKVGGTKNPKVDRIVALTPDLVLLNEEENRREDAEALEAAGTQCHVSLPRNATETAAMVRSIASAIGASAEGERIARDIEMRHRRVVESAKRKPSVRFAYLIWRNPWMAASADTFISALLTDPGGINVFAHAPDRYPTITPEALLAADPALVLLSTEPFPFKDSHADELTALASVPRGRFRIVDGELLSWHGSRTPAGIDYAEQVIEQGRQLSAALATRPPGLRSE
jgi:ABC-type Fe3+-hydroxamate transport system substrate-binding protein